MGEKTLTKPMMKKYGIFFAVLTAITLSVTLYNAELRIFLSVVTFMLSCITFSFWRLWRMPDEEFEKRMVELVELKAQPSSDETTEFNLYYSPDAFNSPHNDN